jgi:hypothetical protein
MRKCRLLYLSAHQLAAWRWQRGTLTGEGVFAATADGQRQFADYLAQQRSSVFAILANVGEEGFQIETIPFLRGADRQTIIERKLGQLFFNTALTTSLSLGHEKNLRKDERVLLAALTDQAFFAPWLEAIAKARVALAGIYSLPLLAPSLLRRLGIGDDRCLLLTVQDQSMRQSYFEKGEILFSRLAPLPGDSDATLAQSFHGEAHKLRQYLVSQRLIARQQTLVAYLLAHANAAQAIAQFCADSETIRYQIIDIELCAKKVGLRSAPSDSHGEQLFLAMLAGAPPHQQFADARLRHDHQLRTIRSALRRTGAAALAASLLVAATLLFEAQASRQQRAALDSEAALARARYGEIVKTFPPIPTDHETLRRVVERYRVLEKQSATPEDLYREISRALRDAPAVEISSIDWQAGGQTAGANRPGVVDDSVAAIVRGTLRLGANASARQLLAAFNDLVASLKANPKLQVAVLQRPFDIESAKSLKGDEISVENDQPRSFALQLSRKIAP